jgi:hypothetical protein
MKLRWSHLFQSRYTTLAQNQSHTVSQMTTARTTRIHMPINVARSITLGTVALP